MIDSYPVSVRNARCARRTPTSAGYWTEAARIIALLALGSLFVSSFATAAPPEPQAGYTDPRPWERDRPEEARVKVERLRQVLAEKGLDGYLITTCHNFSWITAGADHDVILVARPGLVKILVTPTQLLLIAADDECDRVMYEELEGLGYRLLKFSNYASDREILDPILDSGRFASDAPGPGIAEVMPLHDVRTPMLPSELERYRWLGVHTVEALGEVARQIRPGDSELEVKDRIAIASWRRGILPTAILVGADRRPRLYRHPVATRKKIEQTVMFTLCARRWGLVVAVTRFVHFGEMSHPMRQEHETVRQIQADVRTAMKPGASQRSIFQTLLRSFARTENPEEWRKHGQGGPIGYLERDYLVGPETETLIMPGQAQAWHPTYGGAKCEETVFLHSDGTLETGAISVRW